MSGGAWLQLFLFVNVFVIGMLVTLALQHGRAHFKPRPQDRPKVPAPALPAAVRERLQQAAQIRFETALNQTAIDFEKELKQTAGGLTKQLDDIAHQTIGKEMDNYRDELAELRAKAEASIGGAEADVASHQNELKAKLDADIEAEKQQLLAQIDTKLADAVASFLGEALGHNVDLGAQASYLTALLEEHKDDFKREIA